MAGTSNEQVGAMNAQDAQSQTYSTVADRHSAETKVRFVKSGHETDETMARNLLKMVPGADEKSVDTMIDTMRRESRKTPGGTQLPDLSTEQRMAVVRESGKPAISGWLNNLRKTQQAILSRFAAKSEVTY